ncbi:MAG TPA: PaaI family thioesterase [Acidimicrobiales bacterium]|nr:PaaI family thioesterase [Acidimicrobiales bacterium]
MTDLPDPTLSVPGRLGVSAHDEDGELVLELTPQEATLHHGVIRASALSFVVDAAAGIVLDRDTDAWTLTTDLSLRLRPLPAPEVVRSRSRVLRQGGRSSSCLVELTTGDGAPVGSGVAGFARVPRRPGDPPKPPMTPERAPDLLGRGELLARPLREEAGIEVLDPHDGVVQVAVTPELRNPAGTLQGAMVALVAEAAAEDLVATRFGSPVVVVDLDVRYLAQAQVGPVRTRSTLLGDGPDAPVQVELVDTAADRVTTLVYARAVPPP